MAIILEKKVKDNCLLGMWEITEGFGELLARVSLDEDEKQVLFSFKNCLRQIEWLSVRALLNEMLGCNAKIVYNEEHKPFLFDGSYNISISHSKNLSSILLSKNNRVGIDLEYMSHRIHNIAHKFINEREFISPDPTVEKIHLYIHWCAKEALYKICDKKDINFKENLTIHPFSVQESGIIRGDHHNGLIFEEYDLYYQIKGNYVIVYSIK